MTKRLVTTVLFFIFASFSATSNAFDFDKFEQYAQKRMNAGDSQRVNLGRTTPAVIDATPKAKGPVVPVFDYSEFLAKIPTDPPKAPATVAFDYSDILARLTTARPTVPKPKTTTPPWTRVEGGWQQDLIFEKYEPWKEGEEEDQWLLSGSLSAQALQQFRHIINSGLSKREERERAQQWAKNQGSAIVVS